MPLSLNTDTDASKNNGESFYNTEAGEKQEQKKKTEQKKKNLPFTQYEGGTCRKHTG